MAERRYFEDVASTFASLLRTGEAPWQADYDAAAPRLPRNPKTGASYGGINSHWLMAQGRTDPRWLTRAQAAAMGGDVKEGEAPTVIVYWKTHVVREKHDDQGQPVFGALGIPEIERVPLERPELSYTAVFNAEQVEGLPPFQPEPPEQSGMVRLDAMLKASRVKVTHEERRSFAYDVDKDELRLPLRSQFDSPERYYQNVLRGLVWASAHPSRLDRWDAVHQPPGSDAHLREKLRTAMAVKLLGEELGLAHDAAEYLPYGASWAKLLADSPLDIFEAAADAGRISKAVLGLGAAHVQDARRTEPRRSEIAQGPALDVPFAEKDAARALGARWDRKGRVWRAPADADLGPFGKWLSPAARQAAQDLGAEWDEGRSLAMTSADRTGRRPSDESQEEPPTLLRVPVAQAAIEAGRDAGRRGELEKQQDGRAGQEPPTLLRVPVAQAALEAAELQSAQDDPLSFSPPAENHVQAYRFLLDGAPVQMRGVGEEPNTFRIETEDGQQLVVPMEDIQVSAITLSGAEYAIVDDSELTEVQDESEEAMVESKSLESDHASAEVMLVRIPEDRRTEAAALGVLYQVQLRSYYLPPGAPAHRKQKVEELATHSRRASCIRLAVPYEERAAAKAAGAWYDKPSKCWYGRPGQEVDAVRQWLPTVSQAITTAGADPREEFASVLRDLGFKVAGEHPIFDGKLHRISIEGDRGREKGGSYIGHLTGSVPAGYYKNFRTGEEGTWAANGYVLDETTKGRLTAEANAKRAEEQEAVQRQYEKTAERLEAQVRSLRPLAAPTPYQQKKGLKPTKGCLGDGKSDTLFLPLVDAAGKLWSMEYIRPDGTKRGAKHSRRDGCFHVVGGVKELAQAPVLVIAEGYSTASTLSAALSHPVVAAMSAGNLPAVAKALHERYPSKQVLIAGDDDLHLERNPKIGVNRGRQKAEEAAALVGGKAVFPIFAPKEQLAAPEEFTDFNDLAVRSVYGAKAVQVQLEAVMRQLGEVGSQQVASPSHERRPQQGQSARR